MAFITQLDGGMMTQGREPTLEELRAMAYLLAVYDARLAYQYLYKPTSAATWDGMAGVNAELARVQELTAAEGMERTEAGTRDRRVHYALWAGGGREYLVACNTAPEPARPDFDLPALPGGAARGLRIHYGSRGAALSGRRLSVPLPPHGRAFIELSHDLTPRP
jgi:hypothetical protein